MISAHQLRQARSLDGEPRNEWFVETSEGIEVVVLSVNSVPSESHLAQANAVLENIEELKPKAIRLLEGFMKDKGSWDVGSIDCGLEAQRQECTFLIGLDFYFDGDPCEYGYTYFNVGFNIIPNCHPSDQHGRPIKFVVGFH